MSEQSARPQGLQVGTSEGGSAGEQSNLHNMTDEERLELVAVAPENVPLEGRIVDDRGFGHFIGWVRDSGPAAHYLIDGERITEAIIVDGEFLGWRDLSSE